MRLNSNVFQFLPLGWSLFLLQNIFIIWTLNIFYLDLTVWTADLYCAQRLVAVPSKRRLLSPSARQFRTVPGHDCCVLSSPPLVSFHIDTAVHLHMEYTVQHSRWRYAASRFAEEEETSCTTCLRSPQFRAPPCTLESGLWRDMLFLTLESPTTTIRPTLDLQHLRCAAMFGLKREGPSNTTVMHFLVLDTIHVCPGVCSPQLCRAWVHRNRAWDYLFQKTQVRTEPEHDALVFTLSTELEHWSNHAQVQTQFPTGELGHPFYARLLLG